MAIKNVALLGADGNLGPAVLSALTSSGFNVTVLKRQSSKSKTYDNEIKIADEFHVEDVAAALQGQDAMVVTIKGTQTALQKRLADACVKAGVKRFIPADFGSCDSSSPLTQELLPLYRAKTKLREYLMQLAMTNENFTWTSIVCGHFFDWSTEFLHLWIKERRADILDNGETKFSLSTLARIGEATARTLKRLPETRNRMIYMQSFCVTQNQVIAAYEEVTRSKWEVKKYDSKTYQAEQKRKVDEGSAEAVEDVVWLLGTIDANWETKQNFAMRDLGLENEDLLAAVRKVVADAEPGA